MSVNEVDTRPLAMVTGASRGIGQAIATELSTDHDVLLGGRDREALSRTAAGCGGRAWPVDLTDQQALRAATRDIHRLDVLVHNAAIWSAGPVADTATNAWREMFEVNVFAVVELTRLLLPALRVAQGHVVLINSTVNASMAAGQGAYAASKSALHAFGDVLRSEEQQHGLRVTSIQLGRTDTDLQRAVRATETGPYEPHRYLRTADVADVIRAIINAPTRAPIFDLVVRPSMPAT
ncbi:NADP-dependent 3-hydroxy acid dehydrogenase YdfG [Pseudonocardia kunmingensis]|uniref:NADP-dependent 3-hydroxy acid dehydrogenase YdfG n=1 Tax=Pseudonocardia kunmingensis TaxID=630975 RepID=A0A543DKG3_9PSEU|nr:NADP-dependent 3-hydroxy acid dehydrogenase YdfG [Pseudonocardia kunmingensis]